MPDRIVCAVVAVLLCTIVSSKHGERDRDVLEGAPPVPKSASGSNHRVAPSAVSVWMSNSGLMLHPSVAKEAVRRYPIGYALILFAAIVFAAGSSWALYRQCYSPKARRW